MRILRLRVWVAPLLLVSLFVLFPSCGFITVLFDNNDEEDFGRSYQVQMSYRYLGGFPISPSNKIYFLFVPLNENNEFEEGSFDQAEARWSAVPMGVVPIDLKRGTYSVLGYVDANGNNELNMFEAYAFFFRLDLATAFRNPNYFWVDSSIENNPPYFEMDDFHVMRGVMLFVPENGETLIGQDQGGTHLIPLVGITIESKIDNVQVYVDGAPVGIPVSVSGDDAWSFPVDMFPRTDGWYNVWVDGFDGGLFVDSSGAVNFYYDAP
jgi:hypothetical protein